MTTLDIPLAIQVDRVNVVAFNELLQGGIMLPFRRLFVLFIAGLWVGCAEIQGIRSGRTFGRVQIPKRSHSKVVVVVLENTDFELAMRQPFLESLTQKGAILTNYRGLVRPSQPNYIALVSGQLCELTNDPLSLSRKHLGDLLEAAGRTWKNYAEGYPGHCSLVLQQGAYVRKHVPMLSFKNVQENPERCARVVDGDEFSKDLVAGTLPDLSLYTPDLNNDGHDTSVAFADRWLAGFFKPILEDTKLVDSTLFVITFDEPGLSGPPGNRIATVLLGGGVQPRSQSSQVYTHYNLLRTIEEYLGLPTLSAQDAVSEPIGGIWQSTSLPNALEI